MHRRKVEHRDYPGIVWTERVPALSLGDHLGDGWFAQTIRHVRKFEECVTCHAPGCDWDFFPKTARVQRVVTQRGIVEMHETCAVRMYVKAAGVVLEPWHANCRVRCDAPWPHELTFAATTRTELFETLEENPWFELIGVIRVVHPNWRYPDGDTSFVPGTWLSPDLFCEHADVPMCEMRASDGTLCIREAEHEVEAEDGRRIPLCVTCYTRILDLIHRDR